MLPLDPSLSLGGRRRHAPIKRFALGPITFLREVLSLVVNPALLTHVEASGDVAALFSADAVVRAKKYLAERGTFCHCYLGARRRRK